MRLTQFARLGPVYSPNSGRSNPVLSLRDRRWARPFPQINSLVMACKHDNSLPPPYNTNRILSPLLMGPKRLYHKVWPLFKPHSHGQHQWDTSRNPTGSGLRHRCHQVDHHLALHHRTYLHGTVGTAITPSRRARKLCDNAYSLLIGLLVETCIYGSFFAVRSRILSFALLLFPLPNLYST